MAAALTRLEELESALNVCVHVGMVGVIDGGCVIGVERRGGGMKETMKIILHTPTT
jgi:hypothetical protein